jgi:hypothetical protein
VLTEEKLDDIGARLEPTPRKLLKRPAPEIGVSKIVQEWQHNCWNLNPVKQQQSTEALQQRDPASRVHFCSWFLQSIVEGEINPQLILF